MYLQFCLTCNNILLLLVCYLQDFILLGGNLVKMEESEKGPDLKLFSTTNNSNQVTVNQIFHANLHYDRFLPTCYMSADNFYPKIPHSGEQVSQEGRSQPAPDELHVEPTATIMYLNHHPRLTETWEGNTRGESSCWSGGPDRCVTTGPAGRK